MRLFIPSFMLTIIGIQTVFLSLFLVILDLPKKRQASDETDRG